MKKVLSYLIVGILVIVFCLLFVRVFSFEKENTGDNINISKEVVDKLYSYLPSETDLNKSSMYSHYYMTYNNISLEAVLNSIYNYIYNYEPLNLLYLSQEELMVYRNDSYSKAIYKINLDDFNRVYRMIYGNEIEIKNSNFYLDGKTRALFVENIGYYIYEAEDSNAITNSYVVHKEFSRYIVTDDGNTLKLYDKYTKCDTSTNLCYDDDKTSFRNNVLYDNGAFTNFEVAQEYVHSFKLENGNYYWYSTELSK